MDTAAAAPLVKQLTVTQQDLLTALTSPGFYVEMIFIGMALALAWIIAKLVQYRIKAYVRNHPPKKIDAEFVTKPFALLAPLLALLYLSLVKPFSEQYAGGSEWIVAISKLCVAYAAAKIVLLILNGRAIAWFLAVIIMIIAVLDVSGFMKTTSAYLASMAIEIGSFKLSILNLVHGIVILVIVFWIAGLLSRTLESYLRRSSGLSYNARELIVKFFRIFVYFIAFLITLSAVGVDLTALAVFGGALGVGVGLGLQKITANFVSGVTLLLEKSIKIGDLIEVGGITGWVRALNIRYALVETADGRDLMVPNEELISTRVTNWTYSNDLARIEIKVPLPYDADATQARDLMVAAAYEHKRCLKNPAPLCHLKEFTEKGMLLALTFWIPDVKEGRLGAQSDVMFTILAKFKEAGIEMSPPPATMNIHLDGETLDGLKPKVI